MAANQLQSEWKQKQYKWNEESKTTKREGLQVIGDKIASLFSDIGEVDNGYRHGSLKVEATIVDLLAFEMKAFKITKA